jgi:hypothetical protein
MFESLKTIKDYWDSYGFEVFALACFIIIILLCIYNMLFKDKGSYSLPKKHANYGYYTNGNGSGNGSGNGNGNGSGNGNINNEFEYIQHTPEDSKLELQTKFLLENIFNLPFYKIRPNFLRNEVTGHNLEIDLYNDELKLAIEVQGDQHYKFTPFFHKNKETFMLQRYRDEMKKQKCLKKGITLIEIPYKVGEKGLKQYLLTQLRLNSYLL